MIKYVVFAGKTEHSKKLFKDLEKNKEVMLEKSFSNNFLNFLNKLHTSCKSNYWFNLPFQFFWYDSYLDYEYLDANDNLIFLMCEENRLCYDAKYLHFLKSRYKNAKIIFYAINSSTTIEGKYLDIIHKNYNYVVTFDKKDSEKYGWIYYSGVFSAIERKDAQIKYDVFYAGNNAGRLDILHQIYNYLQKNGIKCLFYINGVEEKEQLSDSGIKYNQKLSYEEILEYDRESNCILEVLRENQSGTTLRMAESILLGKKIITNNKAVIGERYYDSESMNVFASVEDIPIEFCKEGATGAVDKSELLSPNNLLEYISTIVF